MVQQKRIPLASMRECGFDPWSCLVGYVSGVELWLRHRPAAVALIIPPAWEPPHAMGAALKRQKTNKILCYR